MSIRFLSIITILACVITSSSCRKLLEVPPPQNQVSTATVFASDTNALNALSGLYIQMMDNTRGLLNGGLTIYCGLSADELVNMVPNIFEDPFRTNTLSADNLQNTSLYNAGYTLIHTANALLSGLDGATKITAGTKAELRGEAEFTRALVYFYLVNLYGDVPLVTTTDYAASAVLPRATTAAVYRQIVADLADAQQVLPINYLTTAAYLNDRTRPNRTAATALLARVYFYLGQWTQADSAASAVINNPLYRLEPSLDSIFLSGSREAIWQLQPMHENMATAEGLSFLPVVPGFPPFYVLTDLLLSSFESGDQRKIHWTVKAANGKVYPYKYKRAVYDPSRIEYNMVMRLGEIYLLRAEARASAGNSMGAAADLNLIRNRAGLAATTATDGADLLPAIRHERQIELSVEWGQRWLDLKRSGQADAVLGADKVGWTAKAVLYPIPAGELLKNPNLTQNADY
jgi:hypothetical protein